MTQRSVRTNRYTRRIVSLFETTSCVLASAADATVGVKNTAILQSAVCDNTGAPRW